MRGRDASARAISMRRRLAYDSPATIWPARGVSRLPKIEKISIAHSRAAFPPPRVPGGRRIAANAPVCSRACWPISAFSITVRFGNSRRFWNVRAMPFCRIW